MVKKKEFLEELGYKEEVIEKVVGKKKPKTKKKPNSKKKMLEDVGYKEEEKKKGVVSEIIKQQLQRRELWNVIIDELEKKHIGDIASKEIIFLSALGRLVKNKKPYSYNIILHSESSAGKDHLVESVLKLFPEKDIEAFGRISKTALTYLHDKKHEPFFSYDGKVLYLEEITEDILNNEVMKVFTSGLTKSAITKDQKAEEIEVIGKPVVICTTATTKPTPEILNRFSVVKLDESEEQTARTYAMEEEEYDIDIIAFLDGLKEYKVKIPREMKIKIANVFPKDKVKYRRLFPRFLDIVKAITIFHQDLKAKDGEIHAEWEDYDLAVRIFANYRSGVSSIPLKLIDQKIIDILEEKKKEMSAKEISVSMEGYLTLRSIYKHLENLTNHDILETFDLRDDFGNPLTKYGISEEFSDKNPITLPDSAEILK